MPEKAKSPRAEFLTRHAAAQYLGIGTTFLDKLIRSGDIPAFKLGRRTVLLRRDDLVRVATARPLAPATVRRSAR